MSLPEWRPGDFLTRAEHERASAEGLNVMQAVLRRLEERMAMWGYEA